MSRDETDDVLSVFGDEDHPRRLQPIIDH